MKKGERVRWYLLANTNFEMHAPHWHGNTVVAQPHADRRGPLLPMGMLVADMVPDPPVPGCSIATRGRTSSRAWSANTSFRMPSLPRRPPREG